MIKRKAKRKQEPLSNSGYDYVFPNVIPSIRILGVGTSGELRHSLRVTLKFIS